MDIEATPDALDDDYGQPWAHCVAKQININDYQNNPEIKGKIKKWARAVAKAITSNEVTEIFPAPTDTDAYRPLPMVEKSEAFKESSRD